MSIELPTYSLSYADLITLLKSIKLANQNIRNGIDVSTQKLRFQRLRGKVQDWIHQLQSRYLDPQTAKKVDFVKGQLKEEVNKNLSILERKSDSTAEQEDFENRNLKNDDQQDYIFAEQVHENQLNQRKNEELLHAHKKIQNIHSITQQVKELTYKQGEQIDIIDYNTSTTLKNTNQSNSYLQQAQKQQKKSQKKNICLIAVGISVVVVMILLLVLI